MFFKGEKLGKFRIIDKLGSGGFAAVYLAEDTWIKKKVALKVPHNQDAELEDMLQEPRLLAALNHPNIVNVLSAGREGSTFYIVMEYVEGAALAQLIKDKGALPIEFALETCKQICLGLAHAHTEKILHRDLRPSNILLTKDFIVKIADFGISRVLDVSPYAHTKIGSPPYMAPEHLLGKAVFESDIYSLGVMMYEMMIGSLPFYDPNPSIIENMILKGKFLLPHEIIPAFPLDVEKIIRKAMSRDYRARYLNPKEVLDDIRRLETKEQSRSFPQIMHPLHEKSTTPRKRSNCWNCGKPVARFSDVCSHCGEEQ
ncbi:serine/threonine protein kinase [candidate division CSSED10-310 bacterium]|uniref:non-specific serine/threonine protein kinase n=1 Tax=candidate division CSSED10-310 bacterium TaxID=2855610 RepID=A0ABV6Z2B7_UNCC1